MPASSLERLLDLRNDLGLLSEEYDSGGRTTGRQLPSGLLPCVARHSASKITGSQKAEVPTTYSWAGPPGDEIRGAVMALTGHGPLHVFHWWVMWADTKSAALLLAS